MSQFTLPKLSTLKKNNELLRFAMDYVGRFGGHIPYGSPRPAYCSAGFIQRSHEDCVSFLNTIFFHLGYQLDYTAQQLLLIDFPELQTPDRYREAVFREDERILGVSRAVEVAGIGRRCDVSEIKQLLASSGKGLVVQYHYRDGTRGHAGIIADFSADLSSILLYGAHRSVEPPGTGFIEVKVSETTKFFPAAVELDGACYVG